MTLPSLLPHGDIALNFTINLRNGLTTTHEYALEHAYVPYS